MTQERKQSNQIPEPIESQASKEVDASAVGSGVQIGALAGEVNPPVVARSVPVPRQLPPAPSRFIGRDVELTALTMALDDAMRTGTTMVISALGGVGGIGKTWLALQWAHHHVRQFPDGQLFVDLQGFTPSAKPMPTAEALRVFLIALGVEPAGIPVDTAAQLGLYRSLIADRRILIVLDNARDTAQIVSLLPGSPNCTVMVTSRNHLSGLITTHGAELLDLDVLPATEAIQILTAHLGAQRIADEPDAVRELVASCAGLPLALSIVAARAARHATFPLSLLAEELRDHTTRLDGLDAGEIPLNLRAAFYSSYQALSPDAKPSFAILGLAPGPDISLPAVISLIARPMAQVRILLQELETAHLVTQPVPGRYRMHDLLRLYAANQAQHLPPDFRDAALQQVVNFYVHTAYAGDRLLNPPRQPIEIDEPVPGQYLHSLIDQAAAWAWFEAEHRCLLAAQQLALDMRTYPTVWQLAWALDTFHIRQGHLDDKLAAWQAGLTAANHGGNSTDVLRALRFLGNACTLARRFAEALDHLDRALRLARDAGDTFGQAHIHDAFTWAWGQQGDDQQALEHAADALHLFRALGHPVWEAEMSNRVGWYSARLGNHEQARIHCNAALELCERHDFHEVKAATLDSLGYVAHCTNSHYQALDYYQRALDAYRALGHTYHQAGILDRLGHTYADMGEHDQARHTWHQALQLYQEQHRQADADRIRQQLVDFTESPKGPSREI